MNEDNLGGGFKLKVIEVVEVISGGESKKKGNKNDNNWTNIQVTVQFD